MLGPPLLHELPSQLGETPGGRGLGQPACGAARGEGISLCYVCALSLLLAKICKPLQPDRTCRPCPTPAFLPPPGRAPPPAVVPHRITTDLHQFVQHRDQLVQQGLLLKARRT